ncbi:MAG: hypothetical protein JWM27_2219 [Gemmatimonadetes bacterium]|nr:hypothetical protein [Gemmatimonadota bacterium]
MIRRSIPTNAGRQIAAMRGDRGTVPTRAAVPLRLPGAFVRRPGMRSVRVADVDARIGGLPALPRSTRTSAADGPVAKAAAPQHSRRGAHPPERAQKLLCATLPDGPGQGPERQAKQHGRGNDPPPVNPDASPEHRRREQRRSPPQHPLGRLAQGQRWRQQHDERRRDAVDRAEERRQGCPAREPRRGSRLLSRLRYRRKAASHSRTAVVDGRWPSCGMQAAASARKRAGAFAGRCAGNGCVRLGRRRNGHGSVRVGREDGASVETAPGCISKTIIQYQ